MPTPVLASGPLDVDAAEPVGLRERKKSETRQALVDAAVDLATRQGFEATTIDQIAGAVGVSARTFHRYFPRKEDAVLGDGPARLERFRERLSDSPRDVLAGIRAAAMASAAELEADAERERARARLVATTPSLRAHNLALYDEWAAAISQHAAAAVGGSPSDRWPSTLGAVAIAALTSATRRWAGGHADDLAAEYGAVLDLLDGLERPGARR